ncbi:MAG: hypothetical protein JSV92_03020 [archaeon]|nr:MAG: hypothetical protein JSV92_03020 [archaeon]
MLKKQKSGTYVIDIPPQYLNELGWKDGDVIKYSLNKDKKKLTLERVDFVPEK